MKKLFSSLIASGHPTVTTQPSADPGEIAVGSSQATNNENINALGDIDKNSELLPGQFILLTRPSKHQQTGLAETYETLTLAIPKATYEVGAVHRVPVCPHPPRLPLIKSRNVHKSPVPALFSISFEFIITPISLMQA